MIFKETAKETAEKISDGKLSAAENLTDCLSGIDSSQAEINSFITLYKERAKDRAEKIDSADSDLPLAGVPFAVKDNMMLEGTRTTCGSKILKGYISPYTATAVKKLEQAGAVIIGKTNMDEFAMGSSGETSAYGATKNPVDRDKIPGGSSSGSAAAVSAGQVCGSLGSDTGGSIRQPAAMCGVVGLKPTYGLVSRYGLVAFASSLDQIGPFAGNVEDAAVILNVIAGYDPKDSTSLDLDKKDYTKKINDGVEGMVFGIPQEYMGEGLSEPIRERVEEAVKELQKRGAKVKTVSLPHTKYAVAAYYIVAPAEASANLARYDGIRYGYRASGADNLIDEYIRTRQEGFGPEVKRRIMIGTYALSAGYYDAYYLKAQKVRTLIREDYRKAFKDVDLLLGPTSPTTAFNLGEKFNDPLQMYLSDIYTISCNLAGIPGISVPAGTDSGGLPVGLQLMGDYLTEANILRAAREIERIYE